MIHPYLESEKPDRWFVRIFKPELTRNDLLWHFDDEDRIVKKVSGSGWKLQIDNSLPKDWDEVFIPRGTYHRLYKEEGTTEDLIVEIKKIKGSN